MQSAMANSARHSCFYFLSVAMEREDSRKKSERKREQYGVINSRTTDRENFRLIPRDIFQCSKEDSPWRKWGILGKRNFYEILEILSRTKNREINSLIIDLLDVRYFSSLKNNIVTFDSSFYQSIYSMCKL